MTPDDAPEETVRPQDTMWSRGGLWVLAQFPLGGAAFLIAMLGPKLPDAVVGAARWTGVALLAAGGLLFMAGVRNLGPQLTPFPKPRPGATLVDNGAYGLVRHPLYGGGILMMLGWALVNGRWAGLLATLIVAVFFDRKAAVEERFLAQQVAGYAEYRQRVRKLIPWLY